MKPIVVSGSRCRKHVHTIDLRALGGFCRRIDVFCVCLPTDVCARCGCVDHISVVCVAPNAFFCRRVYPRHQCQRVAPQMFESRGLPQLISTTSRPVALKRKACAASCKY